LPDLSILMPVFNERPTVEEAIRRVLEADLPIAEFELIVVDDGSTDGSRELLLGNSWPENVRVLAQDTNRGKGAAVRVALREARGTWTTIMDADLEYDASNLARVLSPLVEGEAEAVLGTREFDAHAAYSFWYVIGNKVITFIANLLYNSWISDVTACNKAMPTGLFRSLPLREDGFAFDAETVSHLLLRETRIQEVPIIYRARRREEGKKLTTMDGFGVLWTLVRCRVAGARAARHRA
jgi:glycosyltransferase involved in cell wall biosynthesis